MATINKLLIECGGVPTEYVIGLADTNDAGINAILATIPAGQGNYVYSHTIDAGAVSAMIVATNENGCTFTIYKDGVAYTSSGTCCLSLDPATLVSADALNFIGVGTDGKLYSAASTVVSTSAAPFSYNAGTNTYNIPSVPSIIAGQLSQGDASANEQIPDFWQQGAGGTGAFPDGTTDITDVIGHQSDIYVGLDALVRVGHGAANLPSNTALGTGSLNANTTGTSNSATGFQSLYSNTTGGNNAANGFQSLYSNLTGNFNSATGAESLYSNTTGVNNSANGYR
jgi:hypothetical protein